MLRPVKITEVSSTPSSVPFRLPWPPIRLVPPMTTAVITSNSIPTPAIGCAERARPTMTIVDRAIKTPATI